MADKPDFSSLVTSLNQTNLQKTNFPLYQTVLFLIKNVLRYANLTQADIDSINEDISKIFAATFLTVNDETGDFANSRQLLAGSNISFDDTQVGKRTVNASGGGGGAGGYDEIEESYILMLGQAGPIGPSGSAGVQGPIGPPGLSGEDGDIGPAGPPGPVGPTGVVGATGSQGPIGFPGIDGEEIIPLMIPGAIGPQGIQGIQGIQGVIGPPGLEGETEYPLIIPGPQGPQGASGGGGGSITTVEADLGSAPAWRGKFTITDASISASSKVAVWQAPGPYTGKGTRADEAEMDPIWCVASPGSGQATVYWRTHTMIGSTFPQFRGNQPISTGTSQMVGQTMVKSVQERIIGRVKGNVKFHYMVA